MSLLSSLLSDIDPSAAPQSTSQGPRQAQRPNASELVQRPAGATTSFNGLSFAKPEKRKAEGSPDGTQTKVQRRDTSAPTNGAKDVAKSAPPGVLGRPKSTPPATTMPYRGTAASGGLSAVKASNVTAKKPVPAPTTPTTQSKPSTGTAPASGPKSAQPKLGSYAAMLAKAKEAQSKQPAAPPVKNEPTKILTKKERLELRAQARAGAKGKKVSSPALRGGTGGQKGSDSGTEKVKKSVELSYKGTAQPKKPVEVGYKGTARPVSASAGPAGKANTLGDRSRSTSLTAKSRPGQSRGRWDGYADWSDLDDAEEEEYESDASSVMEGGLWDVEEEEQKSLATAKKEDLEALKEENELKKQKEERRKMLMAMNKAAAAKRKY